MNEFTYFIAAPFGNYLNYKESEVFHNCISVTGTWTLKYRAGWFKRFWKIVATLRYDSKLNGWVNQLGLPNKGLVYGLKNTSSSEVLSIAAIENDDWIKIKDMIEDDMSIEFNLSCPNVEDTKKIWGDLSYFFDSNKRKWRIAKVSPLITLEQIQFLIEKIGFNQLHLCNTLPIHGRGGLSGPALKPHVLKLIKIIRTNWGDDIEIVAGGGVRNEIDKVDYLSAGANHISLGTLCFKPWKVKNLISK